MTALRNPFVTAAVSLVLALSVGVFTFWRSATVLVVKAIELRLKNEGKLSG